VLHEDDVLINPVTEEELRESRHRLRELSAHLEAVQEHERRALSRALHDEVGQLLTGLRLELSAAIKEFRDPRAPRPLVVADRLQAAVGLLDLSIASIRRISSALRPPILDHLGLESAIRWEASVFEKRTGIRCRVYTSPAKTALSPERVTAVYRILLEALTNIARHAQAGTVLVRLRQSRGVLTLEVRDNGLGISDQALGDPHAMGLLGMRERALTVGGDVRITRGARGGTNVLVILPVEPEPPAPPDSRG
jgi:signal transduction histidine kinase